MTASKYKRVMILTGGDLGGCPDRIRILPVGAVNSEKGSFTVDEESYRAMKAEMQRRGIDIVIDYEHQTLKDVQAPAGGWVKELIYTPEAIEAKVEWTPKAQEYLKNKEYRYLSPVVLTRKSDNKAVALHSLALTNTPAINGMFAIVNKGCLVSSLRSLYCVSFWECAVYDGVWQYDDSLQYDARRRYKMCISITDTIKAYIMQSIKFGIHSVCTQILNAEYAGLIKRYKCRIKESGPKGKARMRICVEITFPRETIDNVYVETCRNVAYFDDMLTYDGAARYDALYRKEEVE